MGLFRKLVLIFTLIPLVEFFIFYSLASVISLPYTIAIIIITGFLGAWLTKSQGFKTLMSYQKAVSEGRLPHREAIDGIIILLAGAVLLTPGFLTDAVGFALLVPPVREKVRKFLGERLKNKVQVVGKDLNNPITGKSTQRTSSDVFTVESEVIDETNRNEPGHH
ncbi:MAG: FxsA family protein [Verrucomicrobiales bacterium]|nr:FxsA family protein [Verrucomicrobiales bacterium]